MTDEVPGKSERPVRDPAPADAVVPLVMPAYLSIRKVPASSALVCSADFAGIPGAFRVEFARRGLAPTNLSRPAADSGTVAPALVPWNRCGASALSYLPFAVFNHAGPALSVLYGITGFETEKADPVEAGPGTPAH
ncbi:hypothetical protein ACFRQM_34325 [Streptomyces sp. NPDC056831]|uniref:hypothetical protein n=1 Tax=Streptomyces sp. NPDC056831 TaxID=3345954 RepID=UPI00368C5190